MLKEMTGRDGTSSQSTKFWKGGRGEETMLKPDFDPSGSCFSDCSRLSDSGRTSPASVGMVLMAWCSASIFSVGPVMREVPVSTMAWQLGLQRFSWSPTATLCVETWNQSLRLASKTNCARKREACQRKLTRSSGFARRPCV